MLAKKILSTSRIFAARAMSSWSNVPLGPPDPILGLVDAFKQDTHPDKVRTAHSSSGLRCRECASGNDPPSCRAVAVAQLRVVTRTFLSAPRGVGAVVKSTVTPVRNKPNRWHL